MEDNNSLLHDTGLVARAQEILSANGIDIDVLFENYSKNNLKQENVVNLREIAREIREKTNFKFPEYPKNMLPRCEVKGILKGKIWIADDFCEHQDDL